MDESDQYSSVTDELPDIWAGYDPENVRRTIRAGAGIPSGIDTERLKADIRAGRAQRSTGRHDELLC